MAQLYAQQSQQGVWTALGPPQSCSFALAQSLTVTYGDGTQDTLSAHVPAVTSAGTTQVDRTGAVWLLYVASGDPTLRIVREMDQGQVAGSYAPLARVLADRVVPYQPDNGQAQSSTSGQSFLPLTVHNNSSTQSIGGSQAVPVPAGSSDYVVQCHLSGSTATGVWNALSDKTSFSDLQVLFAGSEIDADIDQQTNGAWSSSSITLWFRLQRPIGASGTDQGYQLRVGGGLRSNPPRSWANIYPFSDDFSSWVSGNWGAQPAYATLSGGLLSVAGTTSGARSLLGSAPYNAYASAYALVVCARLHLPAETGGACFLGWTDGTDSALADADRFYSTSSWGVWQGGTFVAADPVDASTARVYSVGRDAAGNAIGWRDGGTRVSCAGAPSTHALAPLLELRNSASTLLVDWVKVRPFCSSEPTVSAGTLQSAGPLRWEPLIDSTGSVLIATSGDPIMALVAAS